jgi:hypothetical protein
VVGLVSTHKHGGRVGFVEGGGCCLQLRQQVYYTSWSTALVDAHVSPPPSQHSTAITLP